MQLSEVKPACTRKKDLAERSPRFHVRRQKEKDTAAFGFEFSIEQIEPCSAKNKRLRG